MVKVGKKTRKSKKLLKKESENEIDALLAQEDEEEISEKKTTKKSKKKKGKKEKKGKKRKREVVEVSEGEEQEEEKASSSEEEVVIKKKKKKKGKKTKREEVKEISEDEETSAAATEKKELPDDETVQMTSNMINNAIEVNIGGPEDVKKLTPALAEFGKVTSVEKKSYKVYTVFFKKSSSAVEALKERAFKINDTIHKITPAYKLDKKSLLCSNLPFDTSKKLISEHFEELGSINQVQLIPDDMEERLFAIITFKKELGDEALDFDGATINGKKIGLRFLTGKDKCVILRNLNTSMTNGEIREYVSEIGKVENVTRPNNVMYLAIVEFSDIEAVIEAGEYNGAEIHGKSVSIRPDFVPSTGNKRKSFQKGGNRRVISRNESRNKKQRSKRRENKQIRK